MRIIRVTGCHDCPYAIEVDSAIISHRCRLNPNMKPSISMSVKTKNINYYCPLEEEESHIPHVEMPLNYDTEDAK